MKVRDIDTNESVYLLTSLPDGCPAIALHRPFAEDSGKVKIVAVFRNDETGHELASEICELKNDSGRPYLSELIDAQDRAATAIQDAALAILERTENMAKRKKGGAA